LRLRNRCVALAIEGSFYDTGYNTGDWSEP
jgi:hypothetical protein